MAEFIEVLSEQAIKDIDKLVSKIEAGTKAISEFNAQSKNIKVPSQASEQIKKTSRATQKLSEAQKESQRLSRALERQKERLAQAESKQAQQLQKLRFETAETNKRVKEAAILSSDLASAYQKTQIRLSRLIKEQQDLMLKQELGNKLTKKESDQLKRKTAEIQRLDSAMKRTDASVGKFQRNVGNYTSALSSAGRAARSMASALGLMGGAFLIANVIRDAFNRIRQFDKAMQNLAGILGTSRSELKGLEQSIVNVAGESIKTSNEVADLATSLITLGKTEGEVKLLLKPVNDLGIALQTTGDQAGELLIQTLNAFGQGADQGQRFADIIARVRTSTALDFERIKDSLGFVAPTANALGLTLEQTAAILGTLNDNGIKAARAGRLMNSSFARLNKEGMNLQDALDAINSSTDKVTTATELFGTESFSLGLILADNEQKTKRYTEQFENASGALDELTNEQLKSLDAQLKILDSTWEKFLLNLDNGQGVMAKTVRGIVRGLTTMIEGFSDLSTSQDEKKQQAFNKVLQTQAQRYGELGKAANDYAKTDLKLAQNESIRLMKESTRLQNEIDSTWSNSGLQISKYKDELDKVNQEYNRQQALIKAASDQLQGKNKIEKESKEETEALQLITEKYYTDLISSLRKEQKEKATTTAEWQKYQRQIEDTEKALKRFKGEFDKLAERENQQIVDVGISQGIESSIGTNADLEEYVRLTKEAEENTEKLIKALAELQKQANKDLVFDGLRGLGDLLNIDTDKLRNSFDVLDSELSSKKEQIEAFAEITSEVLGGIGQTLMQNENIRIENQIAQNRKYYDEQIRLAEGNQQQQDLLREEQARKERELRNKQVQNEKKAALFEIAINTATAIVKALPNIPLSIAVGAIGAAKAAIVASRPVPEYKTGRKGGKEEWAILGDGYKNEPIIDKYGNLKDVSPNRPTMMKLDKGDSVLPDMNRLSDDIMSKTMLLNIQASANRMTNQKQNKGLEKALQAQSYNLERSIIKSLKKAKFVNNTNTNVDLGYAFKVNKYKGK